MAPTPSSAPLPGYAQTLISRITEEFHLSDETLLEITRQFITDFNTGLSKYGEDMAMIPTFVEGVPNGTEEGTFLALDLGGTNLRVCEVKLDGKSNFTMKNKKFKVSDELKTGEAVALFDYMAESVFDFLNEVCTTTTEEEKLHLGLTFSFPVEQSALASGKLLTWTKGFSATNAVGNDVVQLLQDAFDRKGVRVKCVALINDTVGTLMTRGYLTGGGILGAIFGTGTNGAYVEEIKNIKKLNPNATAAGGQMLINAEWGAFDNARRVLPLTQFDARLDRESINPRRQTFEKFISGMYLGEIVRNILLYLIDTVPTGKGNAADPGQYILFGGRSTKTLNTQWGLDSSTLSDIEGAKDSAAIRAALVKDLGFQPDQISDRDSELVLWACRIVADRAAALSACAVAAVLTQTGNASVGGGIPAKKLTEKLHIGVDGSLIEFYPKFEARIRGPLAQLVGKDVESNVVIGLAKDGSGIGAALGALQAIKQEKNSAGAAK